MFGPPSTPQPHTRPRPFRRNGLGALRSGLLLAWRLGLFLCVLPGLAPKQAWAQQYSYSLKGADGGEEPLSLFAHSANDLLVNIWSLSTPGQAVDTTLTLETDFNCGATQVLSAESGYRLRLIPEGRKCKLELYVVGPDNLRIPLGERRYRAQRPPVPEFSLLVDGQQRQYCYRGSGLKVAIDPHYTFQRLCPRDARYAITQLNIWVKSGAGRPDLLHELQLPYKPGMRWNLGDDLISETDVAKGDMLLIELAQVHRLDYRGEPVDITTEIPLHVREQILEVIR